MTAAPRLPFPDPKPTALSGAERLAWVRLVRSPRVGAATFRRLLDEHSSAQAALAALPQVARGAGVDDYRPCPPGVAQAELDRGAALGAQLLVPGRPGYPDLLARIDDRPPLLWALGDPALAQGRCIALVGARNASALGTRMAAHLARALAEMGFAVVSGLARGIDTAAHQAALDTGTVAVLAGGVDVAYPRENEDLQRRIGQRGLLLSEMPPGMTPQARHFPRRNRIISGLVPGLVVVEGAAKSGSLITARTALDQGREVMAVPGHPFDARASGCNMLIRDGATLVRSAEDIAAALDLPRPERRAPAASPAPPPDTDRSPAGPQPVPAPPQDGTPLVSAILNLLGPAPISEDALIRQIRRPAPEILAALGELDLTGQILRHSGGLVSRPPG
ncbi:DNA-protecting protein DprA [Rhodobacteraceae bacterium 2CG4]|uniref:DNA-protecting protein DprA n=1 Tax=Halovulum marinum TaxID=2662447 RepID=A0A6L5YWA1_9RHOB|nr:DNA-processing protein DprA [Halovulum marinum]MSU88518.1 DNA-protecting protein DprA [Halovulum marinum]